MSPVIEKSNNLIDRLLTSQILVGLDVGYKTIGIAVSDRSFTIATPINTVSRKGTKKDLFKIKEYLNEYEIGAFIVLSSVIYVVFKFREIVKLDLNQQLKQTK